MTIESWQRCTPSYVKELPILDFPFEKLPDIFTPSNTVLRYGDGSQAYIFQWSYLRREGSKRGAVKTFDTTSLSKARVKAIPFALQRLSKWFHFTNARPRTVGATLNFLGNLLSWADEPQHGGRYEKLLDDPSIAAEALKGYHTYLRNQMQNHQLSASTASERDGKAIACLSEIHGQKFRDHIEPLQSSRGAGTKSPDSQAVGEFISTLQAIFDSVADLVSSGNIFDSARTLRVSAKDDSKVIEVRKLYGPMRIVELACLAFVGMVFADSGANLSVLAVLEEPEDLETQLAAPDRIGLKQKSIKFRAGRKLVEVHLSALTVTRLKEYRQLRKMLIETIGCDDISPLLIRCIYAENFGEPTSIAPLNKDFLQYLRRKISRAGASLPSVTFQQLRTYKQQELVTIAPLPVASKLMGHTVKTAIEAYCKAKDATRRVEVSQYFSSLSMTVGTASKRLSTQQGRTSIPVGACADPENPSPLSKSPPISPDCEKFEGCFFCDKYRLHADEEDMRKLMSCRRILKYLAPLSGDSLRADRIYTAVVDRISTLLDELKRRKPEAYDAARAAVEEHGQLTRYWSNKLQQLHLLGMLSTVESQ